MREMVIRVRNNFVSFIDEFSLQLKRNLVNIDTNASFAEYINEDRKQDQRLKTLEEKHHQMNTIIEQVEGTPRH